MSSPAADPTRPEPHPASPEAAPGASSAADVAADVAAGLPAAPVRVVRDPLTLTLYGPFLAWGWFLYSFTPTVPLLTTELGISRTLAGLHGTAMAVGTVLAGLVSEQLAVRIGRKNQLLLACGLVVLGVVGLLLAPSLAFTLPSVLVAALGGNIMLAANQPALVDLQGPAAPAVLTEANAWATALGLVAPLALGTSVGLGWGWRPSLGLAILATVAVAVLVGRFPGTGALGKPVVHHEHASRGGLGRTFWLLWVALVAAIAIEFCTTFWASDLVHEQAHASRPVAAFAISALLAGMTAGRFAAGYLTRSRSSVSVLLVSYAVAAAGWLVLWVSTVPWLAFVGLLVAGLGYGAHYPVSLSLVLAAAGARADQGQARVLLGAGIAIGVAPFALGAASDALGPHTAFLLVPVLVLVAALAVLTVRREAAAEAV